MPAYLYQCSDCGRMQTDVMPIAAYDRSRDDPHPCDEWGFADGGCAGELRRIYDAPPLMQMAMPGHWNPTLGRYVTGEKDFRDGLKAASDLQSERTGVATNYQPIDMREHAAFDVTAEGLDKTMRVNHADGKATLNLDAL